MWCEPSSVRGIREDNKYVGPPMARRGPTGRLGRTSQLVDQVCLTGLTTSGVTRRWEVRHERTVTEREKLPEGVVT